MRLHRVGRDPEPRGDLLVAETVREEGEDVALAAGEHRADDNVAPRRLSGIRRLTPFARDEHDVRGAGEIAHRITHCHHLKVRTRPQSRRQCGAKFIGLRHYDDSSHRLATMSKCDADKADRADTHR